MKLAYTKAVCPYPGCLPKQYGILSVETIDGGYVFILKKSQQIIDAEKALRISDDEPVDPNIRVEITEQLIRSRTSPEEIVDATNLYLELNIGDGFIGRIFNKFAQTMLDKASGPVFLFKNQINVFGQVYIPFADSPIEDWVLRVNTNPEIAANLPPGTPEVPDNEESYMAFARTIFPFVRVLNVEYLSEDFAEVSIQLTLDYIDLSRAGAHIYAVADSGYLNKRVTVTDANGVARFKARRVDLEPIDDMIVWFGFKFWDELVSTNVSHQ